MNPQPQQQQQTGIVMLEEVVIAFAHGLWAAQTVGGQGRPAFSAAFLFAPDHPCVPRIIAAMQAVARQKWGAQGDEMYQALVAGGRVCLRDGNSKPQYAGYPGNLFISARTPTMPLVIDQNRQPLTQASGRPYSGAIVNASIAIWAQQNQHGRRLNAQLRGVQFVRDGEPLAGGSPATVDEFGEIEQSAMAANEFGALFGGQAPAAPQQQQVQQPPVAPQGQDFSALLGGNAPF